jgi:hypothetical protein
LGSKGTSTQTQTQNGTSTYTPSAATYGAGTQALGIASQAASQPFNLPTAPVAGFNPQQQQAFQQYGNLQNIYQPYYNQAQGYFNQSAQGPQTNNFLNPYANYVLGNLQEQQGQQMNQLTGSATQTAGGVGADRIGVAQGELARQQGLATGQTLSGIYGSALSAAQQQQQLEQSAGYGMGQLGGANLNSALSATGALYGSGAYQQQLNQAQLNAQYQNQLQQQAYPFQTAQYLANVTGGLAGALGGTTNTNQTGVGTNTPAQPSIWSQILSGAGVGTALLGATGAFGSNGYLTGNGPSYGGGSALQGDAYGGSSNNPLPGLTASDYGAGYADGGSIPDVTGNANWMSSDPIVGTGQIHAAPLNIPKITPLNMNTNSGNSSSGSNSVTSDLGNIAKIATMFMNRGGTVRQHFADGGSDVINPDTPYRMPDPAAVTAWRQGTDAVNNSDTDSTSPSNAIPTSGNTNPYAALSPKAADIASANRADMQNQSFALPYDVDHQGDESRKWAKDPWMALLAASVATMGGTSPYAGVNIGKGLQSGIQTLETQRKDSREEEAVNQRARQLALEAQKHIDQYTRMTPAEAATLEQNQDKLEQAGWQKGGENLLNGDTTWFNPRSGESGVLKADGTWAPKGAATPSTAPQVPQQPPATPVVPPAPAPGATPPVPPPQTGVPPGAQPPATIPPSPQQPPAPSPQAAAPAPYGVKDLASNLEPGGSGVGYMSKGSPLATASTRDAQVEIARQSKAAAALPALQQDLSNMKLAFKALTKDSDQDGFLSRLALQPGLPKNSSFGERLELAKAANAAKIAAGEPPPFDPQKVAAAETINKIQNRMGLTFSSQISPREAFAGQKIGIESSPGLTNSPDGFRRLMATFEGMTQSTQDEMAFFQNYLKKNGTSLGWRQDFAAKNPEDRYVVRSLIGTLPPETQQHLAEDVETLRKSPTDKNKKLFNQHYADTADYFLSGKVAP